MKIAIEIDATPNGYEKTLTINGTFKAAARYVRGAFGLEMVGPHSIEDQLGENGWLLLVSPIEGLDDIGLAAVHLAEDIAISTGHASKQGNYGEVS
ncbi:hypothetical protein [Eilatimonas milleporae]|uniref:Uncharacterized protein n=1 Tax=Eilatimonas milleporae TaxID=911205 RepID=A0A3M0CI78_9PROT|nr:hypothetical protein [Eilatimonas milleporae]RMB09022.1 hypothetical protein BXY39_1669 [Eilatimonas milleporae]